MPLCWSFDDEMGNIISLAKPVDWRALVAIQQATLFKPNPVCDPMDNGKGGGKCLSRVLIFAEVI